MESRATEQPSADENVKRAVALIGMPGAGKSGVGKRLAAKLGLAFFDTDAMVERAERKRVPEIFAEHGEAYFRAAEQEAVRRATGKRAVVSCGGGTPMFAENAALLKARCTVLYLYAAQEALCAHVGDGRGRPLLSGDPQAAIRKLLAERDPVYRALADRIIDTAGKSVEEVAEEAAAFVRKKSK